MLAFTKVKRIKLNNIENLDILCFANNTKYFLIASYLLGKPKNNKTRQKTQQNLMKCIIV